MTEPTRLYDLGGFVIAWISDNIGECSNERCREAIAQGRTVHITPAHTDPRVEDQNVTLRLPTYHYVSVAEAEQALEEAWRTARTVHTAEERDAAYAEGIPVKIDKAGRYV